jgi:hypothetical protein
MNESALDKLKIKARNREFERKAKATKKEQVEGERVEHVHLFGAIYIEPLVSHEPTREEIIIFE